MTKQRQCARIQELSERVVTLTTERARLIAALEGARAIISSGKIVATSAGLGRPLHQYRIAGAEGDMLLREIAAATGLDVKRARQ